MAEDPKKRNPVGAGWQMFTNGMKNFAMNVLGRGFDQIDVGNQVFLTVIFKKVMKNMECLSQDHYNEN